MSVAHDRRTARDALALGLAGLALVLVAALLAHGGAVGTVRTVVACLAILVVPGWLVGRLVDEDGDAIARLAGGTVATLGVIALSGFLAVELGVRVAIAAVAIPLLVLVAIAAVLGASGPSVRRAPLGPLLVALGLGAVALLGAWGTHLALPAVPVEPAFSIQATRALVSPTRVEVTVTVTRVRTDEPTELKLYVNLPPPVAVAVVSPRESTVRLTARRPAGSPACPSEIRVRVVASNGAYLTPPVTCVGG